MLDLTGLFQIAELDLPDLQRPPWTPVTPPRLVPARRGRAGRRLRRDPGRRHPGPPPLRIVRGLDRAVHRPGRRRPDVLTIKQTLYRTSRRFADRARPDQGRRARQAGRRPGRDQGALRRGAEHRLGPQARAGRGSCRVRPGRPQDPLQGRPRRPPRGQPAPALRPHRDGQLQPQDRPDVRRPGPADVPAGDRRRRDRPVQRPDRAVPAADVPAPDRGSPRHAHAG